MKILVLNTWQGECEKEITEYLESKSSEYDVFILQEVNDFMRQICDKALLKCYKIIDSKQSDNGYAFYNQAIYFKDSITLVEDCPIGDDDKKIGGLQYACLKDSEGVIYNLVNVHGVTRHGDNKLDDQDRLRQSEIIIESLRYKEGVKIVAGDFNILRESESVKMFSQNGYQDLIQDYNIYTTRNKYAWGRFPTKLLDSDYVFIDIGTNAKGFEVEDCLVSDHLPIGVEV